MLLRPESKDAFAFGLGSGITASALLRYPLDHLTVAENCAPVIRAAKLFAPWNRGVLTNALTRIRLEDARTVLKLDRQKYDVIVSEPSNPWFASIGSVFSREFYQLAAARLKPGGLMVQWFHMYEMHDGIVDLVLRTFQSVFPAMEIWDSNGGDIILIGSTRPWSWSLETLRQGYQRESVRQDLASVGLRTPEELLARQFASQRTAFAIPGDGAIQSDIFPLLEYEAPMAFYIGASAGKISRFDERTWQAPFISNEKRTALTNFSDASLRFAFTNATVNSELWDAIFARLQRKKDRPSVVSLTTAVPCLFEVLTNTIEEPFPPKTSEDLKQLYRARANLQRAGYRVMTAGDVPAAEALVRDSRPDLVLLDWVLPGIPGLTFARRLRNDQRTKDISIVLLTARAEEQDKVTALESGADDYVTKPFSVGELVARVRAAVRRGSRSSGAFAAVFTIGQATIDPNAHTIVREGETITISFYEAELLRLLHGRLGEPVSRDEILEKVWGSKAHQPNNRTVDNFVVKLRKKIEENAAKPQHIVTIYGTGYKLVR